MAAHDASLHSDLRIGLQLGHFYTEPMLFGWMQFVTHCIKKHGFQDCVALAKTLEACQQAQLTSFVHFPGLMHHIAFFPYAVRRDDQSEIMRRGTVY